MTFIMRGPHPRIIFRRGGALTSLVVALLQLYKGFDSGRIGLERDDRTPSRARRRGGIQVDYITAADLGLKDPPVFESPPCIHSGGQRVFKDSAGRLFSEPYGPNAGFRDRRTRSVRLFCRRLVLGAWTSAPGSSYGTFVIFSDGGLHS